MSYLTKYTLAKDGHIVIIQGMRHVAPAQVYRRIQAEMDSCYDNGFKIFIEGILLRSCAPETEAERVIVDYLSRATTLGFETMAFNHGCVTQAKSIKYPNRTKILDARAGEFVAELVRMGFTVSPLASRLANHRFYWLAVSRIGRLPKLAGRFQPPFFSSAGVWHSVGVLWRNGRVLESLNQYLGRAKKSKKIYIHFGQKHVDGIVSAMKADGWVVKDYERASI